MYNAGPSGPSAGCASGPEKPTAETCGLFAGKSAGSFSKLHMGKTIELVNFSIKQLEELLDPSQHIRIHKSHMINLDKIQSIESYFHGEYILTMLCGTKLKLSRGYKNRLDQIVNQYK